MEIRPADAVHHEAVIDLVLRRTRSLTAALVSDVLSGGRSADHRTLLVGLDGDQVVGSGLIFRPPDAPPGLAVEQVTVEHGSEGRGIGGALHAALDAAAPPGTTFVIGQTDQVEHRSLAVVARWGFAPTEVSVTSRLRLEDPQEPILPDDVTVELAPGLDFDDEDAVERMLDVSQTNPERDQGGLQTLAGLRGMAAEGGAAVPTGVLLRVAGRPAAITYALTARGEAQVVYTGVDPDLRGRGLARLAKEVLHADLAAAGATTCVTNNAEENAGIRHVNSSLGYRPTDAAVFLRRDVDR